MQYSTALYSATCVAVQFVTWNECQQRCWQRGKRKLLWGTVTEHSIKKSSRGSQRVIGAVAVSGWSWIQTPDNETHVTLFRWRRCPPLIEALAAWTFPLSMWRKDQAKEKKCFFFSLKFWLQAFRTKVHTDQLCVCLVLYKCEWFLK